VSERPVVLNSIRFVDKRGAFIVGEDSTITCENIEDLEKHINERHRYWTGLLERELSFETDVQEIPEIINIRKILKMVALYMKVPFSKVVSSDSTNKPVEVRRFAIMICVDRKFQVGVIAKGLKLPHDLVSYHKKKFKEYCETNEDYKNKYLEVESHVSSKLFGIYNDDGSGEKLTDQELN